MLKIAIIGIDNSGKTSVVKLLEGIAGIETIYVTTHKHNRASTANKIGKHFNKWARFGERRGSKTFTGLAYLLHLLPYFIDLKSKKKIDILVSDRDPIIDSLCYAHFYLSDKVYKAIKGTLKWFLEKMFSYPDVVYYLDVSPENSASRYSKLTQLHEKIEVLTRIKSLYNEEFALLEQKGIPVKRIDTNKKSLVEVSNVVEKEILKEVDSLRKSKKKN